MKLDKLLKAARLVALTSDHHSHKMGAVLFEGKGNILSVSCNFLYKTHPEYSRLNPLKTLHAEAAAILKIRHKTDLNGKSLLILRENKAGNMCNAKPCVDCLKLIRLYGIKKIYYSNEQGVIQREDV